jgi:hypothetical protein
VNLVLIEQLAEDDLKARCGLVIVLWHVIRYTYDDPHFEPLLLLAISFEEEDLELIHSES